MISFAAPCVDAASKGSKKSEMAACERELVELRRVDATARRACPCCSNADSSSCSNDCHNSTRCGRMPICMNERNEKKKKNPSYKRLQPGSRSPNVKALPRSSPQSCREATTAPIGNRLPRVGHCLMPANNSSCRSSNSKSHLVSAQEIGEFFAVNLKEAQADRPLAACEEIVDGLCDQPGLSGRPHHRMRLARARHAVT